MIVLLGVMFFTAANLKAMHPGIVRKEVMAFLKTRTGYEMQIPVPLVFRAPITVGAIKEQIKDKLRSTPIIMKDLEDSQLIFWSKYPPMSEIKSDDAEIVGADLLGVWDIKFKAKLID